MVQAVLGSKVAPSGVRMVALILAWHANPETGHAWPGMGTIAAEADLTIDRVKQCLRALKEQRVIEVVSTGGGAASTRYRFTDEWVGKHATRVAGSPGKHATSEGGSGLPEGGKPAYPNKDERQAKPALSSKRRRTAAAGPGRSAPGSSPAAARTGFTDPDYYAQGVTS